MRPASLAEPQGPQERVGVCTVERIFVPLMENQLVEMCQQFDILIPEQAIEVPKISSSSRLSYRRRVLRLSQTAEQVVEVPANVSVSSIRAPCGTERVAGWFCGEVFKVSPRDRIQQRFLE